MDLKDCSLLLFLLLPLSFTQIKPAVKTDEQIIRDLVEQENAGKIKIPLTQNYIFVTGVSPRPVIGVMQDQAKEGGGSQLKRDAEKKKTILRLTVSSAGDVANEYGVYTSTPSTKRLNRPTSSGSYVRTWKKVNGRWMIDIIFSGPTSGMNKKAE
jgi:hypothetical protein